MLFKEGSLTIWPACHHSPLRHGDQVWFHSGIIERTVGPFNIVDNVVFKLFIISTIQVGTYHVFTFHFVLQKVGILIIKSSFSPICETKKRTMSKEEIEFQRRCVGNLSGSCDSMIVSLYVCSNSQTSPNIYLLTRMTVSLLFTS